MGSAVLLLLWSHCGKNLVGQAVNGYFLIEKIEKKTIKP